MRAPTTAAMAANSFFSWRRRPPCARTLSALSLAPIGKASYVLYYANNMSDTITFRPDEEASRALAALTRDGTSISTAVRAALIEAARRQAAAAIRAEAEILAADESDRAEATQVLRDMETLRAW
jgi:hypothetical protein